MTSAVQVLMGIANMKSVISHVAASKYLKSFKPFSMDLMSTDKLSIGE